MKFKLGDMVIVVNPDFGYELYDKEVGTIIMEDIDNNATSDSLWYELDIQKRGSSSPRFHPHEIELLEIYESPLYKLIQEKEE